MDDAERYQALCRMIEEGTAVGLMLDANDTFGRACADAELVDVVDDLHEVIELHAKYGYPAILAWMERKRGTPVLDELREVADKGIAAIAADSKD